MAIEIELKAWLDDPEAVAERLSRLGSLSRSFEKDDAYWQADGTAVPGSGVRVRRERSIDARGEARETALVTTKSKRVSDGIEVNDEREFAVSDAGLFEELLCALGLREGTRKEKLGREWKVAGERPASAEISLVAGLGWFLELEIIAADDGERTVGECRAALLSLLEDLGVSAEKIEARSYASLLRARKGKS